MAKSPRSLEALHEILYGTGISFFLAVLGSIIMFVVRLIGAKYLGPSNYGLFEMINTILGIFVILGTMGIDNGALRFIPVYKTKKQWAELNGYIRFIFFLPTIISVVLGVLLFVFANTISSYYHFGSLFTLMLKLVSITVPIKVANRLIASVFVSQKKMFLGRFGKEIIEPLVLLVGVFAILLFNLNVFSLVVALALSTVSSFLFNLLSWNKLPRPKKKEPYKLHTSDWLKFSMPLFFMGFLTYIIRWTDNLVIGKIMDARSLGIYSIAFTLAMLVFFIPETFRGIVLTVLNETYVKSKYDFEVIFRRVRDISFALSVSVAFIMLFFPKEIITVLFGKDYAGGYMAFFILVSFSLVSIYFYFNHAILLLKKNTKFMFYNSLIVVIINLILNICLVSLLGIEGAAISSGLSLLLIPFNEFLKSRKYIKIGFDLKYNFKYILAGIISIGIIKLLFHFLLNNVALHIIIKLAISFGFYYILFIGLLFIFRTFTKEDFKLMLLLEKKLRLNLSLPKKAIMLFYK